MSPYQRFLPGDWCAVGQMFTPPYQFKGRDGHACAGCQLLMFHDLAGGPVLFGHPVRQEPGPLRAQSILEVLELFQAQHPKPFIGYAFGESVWMPPQKLDRDQDTRGRRKVAERAGIPIKWGAMQEDEKLLLSATLAKESLSCAFGDDELP